MNPRLKRALWCRWFHRWHWPRGEAPSSVTSAAGGQALRLSAGPSRTSCEACEDTDYGRVFQNWLKS